MEDKEAVVSSLLCSRGQDVMFYCFLRFNCNFHDWKLEGIESLMDSLYYWISFLGRLGCMSWGPNSSIAPV